MQAKLTDAGCWVWGDPLRWSITRLERHRHVILMHRLSSMTVCLLCLTGVLSIALSFWPNLRPALLLGQNDFLPIYTGAQIAGTSDLYDLKRHRQLQTEALGATHESLVTTRPPYFLLLVSPLGHLPYQTAYCVWQVMNLACLVVFILLWRDQDWKMAALAACWSVPVFLNFLNGQDSLFLLLWLALAFRFVEAGIWSGLFLALCAQKLHLFLLVPLVLLAQQRWRLLSGTLAGGSLLLAVSFVGGGIDWPARFLANIRRPQIHPRADIMPNLHGLLAGLPYAVALELAAGLAVAILVWLASRRMDFHGGMAVALFGGMLVSHHAYPADCVVLLPGLLLVAARATADSQCYLSLWLLTPFPYYFLLAGPPLSHAFRLTCLALVMALAFSSPLRRATRG